uniref:Uncharacterized protein n=1 Tax=Nelumbo nucifera TaxID=4432 RepID=A0A822YKQ9_NELNU|nr:TPA_asm: hypothetical protein HUJ06_010730 [Nelumbo nucifera]
MSLMVSAGGSDWSSRRLNCFEQSFFWISFDCPKQLYICAEVC